jgi:PAS domain S-box-containing protein
MERGRGRRGRRNVDVSEALDASERRFRSAFDSSAVGMAELDTAGRFTAVNAALLRILGYDEAELLGRSFEDITHPDDLPECRLLVAGLLGGETESFQVEKRYVAKSGAVAGLVSVSTTVIVEREAAHPVARTARRNTWFSGTEVWNAVPAVFATTLSEKLETEQ